MSSPGPPDAFISAYNDRDWERLRATLAPGCVYEEIGRPRRHIEGAEEVARVFQGWATAVPELVGEITRRVAGDGADALEVEWKGSLEAPFGDYAPAGRPPVARAAMFFYLQDGHIGRIHSYYDSLVLYQVLGIGP